MNEIKGVCEMEIMGVGAFVGVFFVFKGVCMCGNVYVCFLC